jgi:DNA-binding transcriptional ArsR family regulator
VTVVATVFPTATVVRDVDEPREAVDPDDAFGAVSDPTRVDILRALARHREEHPEDPSLSFGELRKRVDVRDSGRFLYHLKKLLGVFVEKTPDERYRLTFAGEQIVVAIQTGVFTEQVELGATELDSECPICETTPVGTFEDGVLSVACENDHRLLVWRFPPNAGKVGDVPELAALATARIRRDVESALMGFCGACCGSTATRVVTDVDSPITPRFRSDCDTCGSRLDGPLWYALFTHPEATAFYRRHGWSVRETYLWEFRAEVRETPFPTDHDHDFETHHVVVPLGGEELHALLDGEADLRRTTTLEPE